MTPKNDPAVLRTRFEDEQIREMVILLSRAKKSLKKIGGEIERVFRVKKSKSTIQYIIRRFKDRPSMVKKHGGGKPSKMTAQYSPKMLFSALFRSVSGTKGG